MKTETLKIEGMSCSHCVMNLKKELSGLDLNILDIQIGRAEVEYDESKLSREVLVEAVNNAGYKVAGSN